MSDLTLCITQQDAELLTRVGIALTLRQRSSFRQIVVEVAAGVVTLKGQLPSFFDRQLAAETTRRVAGVREVRDQLSVNVSVPMTRVA
jgi:osmotically-inducible protein OsmY